MLEVRQSRRWSVGTLGNKSFFSSRDNGDFNCEGRKKKEKIHRKRKSNYVIYLMADTSEIVARCRRSAQTLTRRFLFVSYFSPVEKGGNAGTKRERERVEIDQGKEREGKKKRNQWAETWYDGRRARMGDRVGRAVVSLFPSLTLIQQQRNF